MSVSAVFVYEDGKVGGLAMTKEVDVYSRPLKVPFSASLADFEPIPITIPRIDYRRCGTMFDGRPIYCAPGFDVHSAAISGYVTIQDLDKLDEQQRREIRKFVKRESLDDVIELDEWVGSAAGPHEIEELRAQRLAKRGVRLLYAVRDKRD